ncbi:hypothetical Protein YC6258_04327 [Gynuella sunshinyii YC6258]|uniref:Uncharacterized protein n=1 Tax=Gynuella sunshinyii YC6258 TaxID=1445510 RepID=A0A0C5VQ36_9GAMM|nr:hypothetical Protein YC6258_04327 [Gynuella sunshinyii YC6258]
MAVYLVFLVIRIKRHLVHEYEYHEYADESVLIFSAKFSIG